MQKKSNRPRNRRANWYILTKEKEQSYIRQQRAGKVFLLSVVCIAGGSMFIIVGLGNPTRQYEGTKHNVGFDTIDYLIDEYQIPSSGAGHKALFGKGMIAGQKVIVAKPMTYMNLSGESVRELVNYYKVDPESELIVVYDDISLAPGQIRIRKKGSAGGHNGIKNIIANLGTDHFMRVKVGVGEKPKNWDLADYVLSPFTKDERPLVNLAIEHAAKAIEQMLNGDVDAAMNEYNRKSANPAE